MRWTLSSRTAVAHHRTVSGGNTSGGPRDTTTDDHSNTGLAASLRHAGLGVTVATAAPVARPHPLGGLADFVPSAGALAASGAAVREYAAILWYLIEGHFRLIDLLAVA